MPFIAPAISWPLRLRQGGGLGRSLDLGQRIGRRFGQPSTRRAILADRMMGDAAMDDNGGWVFRPPSIASGIREAGGALSRKVGCARGGTVPLVVVIRRTGMVAEHPAPRSCGARASPRPQRFPEGRKPSSRIPDSARACPPGIRCRIHGSRTAAADPDRPALDFFEPDELVTLYMHLAGHRCKNMRVPPFDDLRAWEAVVDLGRSAGFIPSKRRPLPGDEKSWEVVKLLLISTQTCRAIKIHENQPGSKIV